MSEIKVGSTVFHKLHGQCVVIRFNSRGAWIQVWGGPNSDKLYTFKGIDIRDLSK